MTEVQHVYPLEEEALHCIEPGGYCSCAPTVNVTVDSAGNTIAVVVVHRYRIAGGPN